MHRGFSKFSGKRTPAKKRRINPLYLEWADKLHSLAVKALAMRIRWDRNKWAAAFEAVYIRFERDAQRIEKGLGWLAGNYLRILDGEIGMSFPKHPIEFGNRLVWMEAEQAKMKWRKKRSWNVLSEEEVY